MEKAANRVAVFAARIIITTVKTAFLFPRGSCKYIPTCSKYAEDAYEKHSFVKASVKILWRVLRCNPLSRGGWDPA